MACGNRNFFEERILSMDGAFQAYQVAEDVYWVGAMDWNVRNFHGYLTGRGTTYNAFLILGESVTLIDTVKAPFYDEMMSRIGSVVDPAKIETIVSNHSEMDHSGSLPRTIAAVAPKKVYASKMGQKALVNHFHIDPAGITVVGDGDAIDVGGMKLSFVETRMCHWPDSMVSYLHERELLFSQDAFGMHLAGYERFADEVPREVLQYESAKYYANILLHLSPFIEKTLAKFNGLNLPLAMIAPDHGPIWRRGQDIRRILDDYARWAKQQPTNKAVVVYDTMWGSTAEMARAVGEGLWAGGLHVRLMNLQSAHRSDVVTELLEAGALLVGSPTMNNQIFPSLADTMTYLKGLKPRNLVAAAFGSYGWSGEAPKHLTTMLEEMGLHIAADPLRIHYVPDAQALVQCRELGLAVAKAVDELLSRGEGSG
jgi:flavorubredoxin